MTTVFQIGVNGVRYRHDLRRLQKANQHSGTLQDLPRMQSQFPSGTTNWTSIIFHSLFQRQHIFMTFIWVSLSLHCQLFQKCYKNSTQQCTGIPVTSPSAQPKPFFGTCIQDLVASEGGVTIPRNLDKLMLVLEQNGRLHFSDSLSCIRKISSQIW